MLATLAVNDLVSIDVAGWASARSTRVEDIGPDEVVVADPSVRGVSVPSVGQPVILAWTGSFGVQRLRTTLIGVETDLVPQWRLRADGPALSDQRRLRARAVNLTMATVLAGDTATAARLVDLSEGGAHVVARQPIPLQDGALATLVFDIDGYALDVACEVVRIHELEGRLHAGCRFTELSERNADRIRRYVFRRQALERSRLRP